MIIRIFERIDLSVLSETLLFGSVPEGPAAPGASCEERIRAAEDELLARLEADEDAQEAVFLCMTKVCPIYFELGMKAGVAMYRSLQGELPAAMKATTEKKQAPG